MIPINVANSPTAKRVKLIFRCVKCGHESLESLSRFHGRYRIACPECGTSADLKANENRIIIEELVELCAKTDAALNKGQEGL